MYRHNIPSQIGQVAFFLNSRGEIKYMDDIDAEIS